jgi:hypothetical protein
MPFKNIIRDDGIMVTQITGVATDDDFIQFHQEAMTRGDFERNHLVLVDGTGIEKMQVTPEGSARLADNARPFLQKKLAKVKTAMVAESDLVFGMFRMWELMRSDLGYEVKVFRNTEEAINWLHQFK